MSTEQTQGPPDSIAKNPAFVAILTGQIPGVLFPMDREYASAVPLRNSPEDLDAVGLEMYITGAQDSAVIFNPEVVSVEELQAADQADKLAEILPEYGELTGEQPQPVQPNTPLEQDLASTGAPSPSLPPPTEGGDIMAPPPSAVSKPLNKVRAKNVVPGGPTTGPKPGAGRVANMLATDAI